MPAVPIEMPSDTVIVPKMIDLPEASSTPRPASRASSSMCILQGVTILQVDAIPTIGFSKSSSENPTARSMDRLGARSAPSTTMDEWALWECSLFVFKGSVSGLGPIE